MTTKLSDEVALAEFVGRAKAKVYSIFKTLKILDKFNISIFFQLFDCQVIPTLLYASEVWGLVPYDQPESVQMFACKKLLSVRKQTPNCLIYGEMGRFPLSIESKLRAIKYWFKIRKMDENRLPRLAYTRELTEIKNSHNWSAGIKSILEQNGFAYVWNTGFVMYENAFIKELRQRMRDIFRQSWSEKCNPTGKFQTYRQFKLDFGEEKYLLNIPVAKFRVAMARMRIAASYLHVNRRLLNPTANIKCPFCPKDETELHFLMECPCYNDIRIKYIFKHLPENGTTLSQLLANESKAITHDIAMYIFYSFKLRSEKLREAKLRKNVLRAVVVRNN